MLRYQYKGVAKLRGHNIFLCMNGINHDGYLYCIFKQPLSNFDILQGVYAGITSRRLPVCGKIAIHKIGASSIHAVIANFIKSNEVDPRIARLLEGSYNNLIEVEDLPINILAELPEIDHSERILAHE
jgi:hypothetical protein